MSRTKPEQRGAPERGAPDSRRRAPEVWSMRTLAHHDTIHCGPHGVMGGCQKPKNAHDRGGIRQAEAAQHALRRHVGNGLAYAGLARLWASSVQDTHTNTP